MASVSESSVVTRCFYESSLRSTPPNPSIKSRVKRAAYHRKDDGEATSAMSAKEYLIVLAFGVNNNNT